jgi:hypothetical protein
MCTPRSIRQRRVDALEGLEFLLLIIFTAAAWNIVAAVHLNRSGRHIPAATAMQHVPMQVAETLAGVLQLLGWLSSTGFVDLSHYNTTALVLKGS